MLYKKQKKISFHDTTNKQTSRRISVSFNSKVYTYS